VDFAIALPEVGVEPALDLKVVELQFDGVYLLGEIPPDIGRAYVQSGNQGSFIFDCYYHGYTCSATLNGNSRKTRLKVRVQPDFFAAPAQEFQLSSKVDELSDEKRPALPGSDRLLCFSFFDLSLQRIVMPPEPPRLLGCTALWCDPNQRKRQSN
jgi:hypothetical protein